MSRRNRHGRSELVLHAQPSQGSSIARWLLLALALPRVVRILYPQVWVEDDLYLASAFAMTKGLRPYLDFIHPQMPLLEWIGAVYIALVGASHRAMEVLNGLAIHG